MVRVATYIDGFNLYHSIVDLKEPHLKWLNLWKLSTSLLQNGQQLVAVNYFSAYATWLPGPYYRHRQYVIALQRVGVSVFMGKFKKKSQWCVACKKTWNSHEEKESDVHASIRLVADAIKDRFDVGILISADSDLAPAVRLAKAESKKKIIVIAPPGRFNRARDLQPSTTVTIGRLRQSLFPQKLVGEDGITIVERPTEYDPP